ncbi:C4-dicarboxylate ABC transporter substrate-binding protein [Pseudomonas sp. EGD-AK9]|jgi:putative tricarboxylic transport membrane protein|uniref:Bug family tripartite tricarboxylate transporter substrate binding protein n=1 Tax=Pseudomonas sp. EGD-AK9 TaxID=1386078 RepID=UPI0003981E9E|nr:tripartite tricarboxylate transporter substrate-binding protein [Pseudomonas sp. EGD-AK9]ERI53587.1 C4-dicarboxylate ABC transporter substrate-binding protein [Pseudomonas sp. EGD-AK9]
MITCSIRRTLPFSLALLLASGSVLAGEPSRPECIAPSKPGGGFDLTCKLAQAGFKDEGLLKAPMRVTYMPGGIGAVAYNSIAANRRAEPGTLVAFSGASLLNLALGKYGRFDENAVKWLATVGNDYGTLAVREDSPYQNLDDVVKALKKDPKSIVVGGGGSVGGQGWVKIALLARAAGVDPRELRYAAFEGGAEHYMALMGGHVDLVTGSASEIRAQQGNKIRTLAIFSEERLGGELASIPTAREQGYEIQWPLIRGYFLGPDVKEQDVAWWSERFAKLNASSDFQAYLADRDVLPYYVTGPELEALVKSQVAEYRKLGREFGLVE